MSRVKAWLAEREYRPLWHLLAVLFIVACSLLLFTRNFTTRGTMMHVDMTFPLGIDRNLALYSNTWWQYGSVQNIWNTQRVLWSYPLLAAAKVLGLSTGTYILVMFIGTFALAGVSMYALAFGVIERSGIAGTRVYAPFIGAVFAALVFMYNPWSLSHLWPYFGYPAYAVLPLVLLLLVRTVEEPKPARVVGLAVLISVASTGPICVPWLWLLILSYMLFDVLKKRFSAGSLWNAVKVLVPLGALYFVLNAMWILPYLYSQASSKPFVPSYSPSMSQAMLDLLSETNSVVNNLRFASGWGMPVDPQVRGTFWVILSFALPVLTLAALLALGRRLARNRVVVYLGVMFVLSVLLATGSHWILRRPYSWMSLEGPGAANLGWIFRAPDRWLFYAPLFYALVLGILAARLAGDRRLARRLLSVAVVAVVLISFIPIAVPYARNVYDPAPVPDDYERVNEYVRDHGDPRVMWMPFARSGFNYDWAPEKRIGAFNSYSSNPNLNNLQDFFAADNFYYWLESVFSYAAPRSLRVLNRSLMLQGDIAARLFVPFSAGYMIFDNSVPGYRFGDSFSGDGSLSLDFQTDILDVYGMENRCRILRPATRTVRINSHYDELAIAQRLTATDMAEIAFIERDRPLDPGFGVLDIDDYTRPEPMDSGIDEVDGGGRPLAWSAAEPDARVEVSVDAGTGPDGSNALKVTNDSGEGIERARIVGPEIAAEPGSVYTFSSRVRYLNSTWTAASVEGYDTESGKWVSLVNCPALESGTSGWKRFNCSFWLPPGIGRMRPVLTAGWAQSGVGPGMSWFDDVLISRVDDSLFAALRQRPPPPEVTYRKVNPEKYEVTVEGSTQPFVLVFGEAYDPFWQVRMDGKPGESPTRLYSVINGYGIRDGGKHTFTLEYTPRKWFLAGLVVALTGLALCLAYLLYHWVRKRRRAAGALSVGKAARSDRSGR